MTDPTTPVRADGTRLTWRSGGETVVVEPWGRDSVRVRATVLGDVEDTDWANVYPQAFARAFYEGQVADGESEVVNLVRCAWAGSQRYGGLVWSGDISSTFEDLARQVTAGIHMGVAGIPWFTTDIGGFHRGDVYLPAGVRWTDAATGAVHDGGVTVRADAPLDVVPVFLRDGALPHVVGRTTGRVAPGAISKIRVSNRPISKLQAK